MNLTKWPVLFALLLIAVACHRGGVASDATKDEKRESKASVQDAEEMGGVADVSETVIYGKVLKRWVDAERFEGDDHPCDLHPCEARVEVVTVQQTGSDYHGQFESSDMIDVHFDLTLDPTAEIFPELNAPLDGLLPGDYFKASIHTSTMTDHPDRYRVKEYEKQ